MARAPKRPASGRPGDGPPFAYGPPSGYRPHVGYRPNVGLVLIAPDRRLFVGRRIGGTDENWQMPQGGVDKGETPVEAACRELWEEVGTSQRRPEVGVDAVLGALDLGHPVRGDEAGEDT